MPSTEIFFCCFFFSLHRLYHCVTALPNSISALLRPGPPCSSKHDHHMRHRGELPLHGVLPLSCFHPLTQEVRGHCEHRLVIRENRLCCKNARGKVMGVKPHFLFSLDRHSKQAGDERNLPLDVPFFDASHLLLLLCAGRRFRSGHCLEFHGLRPCPARPSRRGHGWRVEPQGEEEMNEKARQSEEFDNAAPCAGMDGCWLGPRGWTMVLVRDHGFRP